MKSCIGTIIRTKRKDKGFRQSELADLAGLKQPNLSRIEAGRVEPRRPTLERLAEALGTTEAALRAEASRYAGAAAGSDEGEGGTGSPAAEIPVLETASGYNIDFDGSNRPASARAFTLRVPRVEGFAFALRVHGDAMESESGPDSFRHGDIIVFAERPVRPGDFGLVRTAEGVTFRRVFFDEETVRLAPLNRAYREQRVRREDMLHSWKMVQHVKLYA